MDSCKDFPENQDVGYWLHRLTLGIENNFNQMIAHLGLTSSQIELLMYLLAHEGEDIYQIDIQKAMHRSNPTITGIVKRLEKNGFIERIAVEEDKRFKKIVATEQTRERLNECMTPKKEAEENLLRGFSEEEKAQLLDYLKRMNHNVRKEKEDD